METNDKQLEARLRRKLHAQGYSLKKSRVRNPHINNRGGYMIVDTNKNMVINGVNFELTLKDVEGWATKTE